MNKSELVFVRSLHFNEASILSTHPFAKAEHLNLALGSLPHFPNSGAVVDSEVLSCKAIDSCEESFLVRLKLNAENNQQELKQYLEYLSNKQPKEQSL